MADVVAKLKEYEDAIEAYAHAGVDTVEKDFAGLEQRIKDAWQKVEEESGELGDASAAELKKAHAALLAAFYRGKHDVRAALDKVELELDEVRAKLKDFRDSL